MTKDEEMSSTQLEDTIREKVPKDYLKEIDNLYKIDINEANP